MAKLTLPNGKSQFSDANGKPYSGGKVYHYIPSTSTPKDTWQDQAGLILNTNPVVLDTLGEATIFADGVYRQVLTDSLGNQIWDQVTATASTWPFLPLTGGVLTGTLTVPSLSDTGGQLLTVVPTADAVSTLASLNIQGTTTSATVREYLAAISLIANKRNGAAGSVTPTTALYTGIQGQNGTSDIWALRSNVIQDLGSGTYNAIGHEIDVVNNVANRGESLGAAGLNAPVTYGHTISGSGSFRSTSGYLVTGPGTAVFNRGFTVTQNSVAQAAFQDLGNSTVSYESQGTHTYVVDMMSATASGAGIRLANGHYIKARDVGNTVDYKMLVQSGTNLVIGDPTTLTLVNSNFYPFADNTYLLGNGGIRWASVWAANGTIQTSDPALKTDIAPIASLSAAELDTLLSGISPIRFRWKSGGKDAEGNDIPGKRQHWGWSATEVKKAFDGIGQDFGGYVLAENGVQSLRPDQLVPVLWQLVKNLSARVAALETAKGP